MWVRSKHENGVQLTDLEEPEVPWPEFVRSLAGAWADDFPNLETIRAGMGQDVLRESL